MSKASPALGDLVAATEPLLPTWAPTRIQDAIDKIEREATAKGLGRAPWLTIVTATTMTRGSPASIAALSQHVLKSVPSSEVVDAMEFIREVGMSCMVMNGTPRTVVMLNALRESLPHSISTSLSKSTTRHIDEHNIASVQARGRMLWEQIHGRFSDKLEQKFSEAHPDLPIIAIGTMYGNLLINGRVTTSIGSMACLQSQIGFAAQVFDHVCGLKNAWKDGSWKSEPNLGSEEGIEWLLSDGGSLWILEKVDELVDAIGQDEGVGLAQYRSKL